MIVRIAFLAVLAICIAGAALVFEAASQTKVALELAATAQTTDSAAVRAKLLTRAAEGLEHDWAQPLVWHAGANEALSAIYAERGVANSNDPRLFDKSATAAARAVALAPVQPHAWTRLAAFAAMGRPNLPCTVKECLTRSWASAKMIDNDTACVRLRLAHDAGILTGPKDERITWFVKSGAPRETIAKCLAFLPPGDLFGLLLSAE